MIKDSGKTEEFSTGYIRDSREGKGLFILMVTLFIGLMIFFQEIG